MTSKTLPVAAALAVPACLLALAVPGVAWAGFTRAPHRSISSVPEPGGVGVNGEGDVWVGSLGAPGSLYELGPAGGENALIAPAPAFAVGVPPASLAVEQAPPAGNGDIYVTDPQGEHPVEAYSQTGRYAGTLGSFAKPHVAVDDDPETDVADPSRCALGECTVYVSSEEAAGRWSVQRLSAGGAAVPFAEAGQLPYVKESKITGRPEGCGETFGGEQGYALAVDAQGDIYVADTPCSRVFEYEPSGKYVRAFELEGEEVPKGWSEGSVGVLEGVAVDPVSGHLLVTLRDFAAAGHVGAIDEFGVYCMIRGLCSLGWEWWAESAE